jgi:hypothetical protein
MCSTRHNRWISGSHSSSLRRCRTVQGKTDPLTQTAISLETAGSRWIGRKKSSKCGEAERSKKSFDQPATGRCLAILQPAESRPSPVAPWTAHEPSQEFRCLYGVNQARDWHEFLTAFLSQCPTLNYALRDSRQHRLQPGRQIPCDEGFRLAPVRRLDRRQRLAGIYSVQRAAALLQSA